jgi:pyrroline-5-carboxylate reductase
MMLTQSLAFIGGGNMTSALIEGLLRTQTASPDRILVSDVNESALAGLRERHNVETTSDNARACASDVVLLCVKPQIFPTLLPELAKLLTADRLVISIAAGVPLGAIESQLTAARVLRAMPNTPALVSAGATALARGARASEADLALAGRIFSSVGKVVDVLDAQMDAVTALSGSGPAYLFLIAEALIESATQLGLPAEVARVLTAQTIYGAGKLLGESSDVPSELRRKVTSPGGTTAAGIAQLESHALRETLAACLRAACARGAELGAQAQAQLENEKPR